MFTLLFFATAFVLFSSHPAHLYDASIKLANMISGCGCVANKSTNHIKLHHLFLIDAERGIEKNTTTANSSDSVSIDCESSINFKTMAGFLLGVSRSKMKQSLNQSRHDGGISNEDFDQSNIKGNRAVMICLRCSFNGKHTEASNNKHGFHLLISSTKKFLIVFPSSFPRQTHMNTTKSVVHEISGSLNGNYLYPRTTTADGVFSGSLTIHILLYSQWLHNLLCCRKIAELLPTVVCKVASNVKQIHNLTKRSTSNFNITSKHILLARAIRFQVVHTVNDSK
ncbi:hypothetical protein M8C21_028760 [Ambrosia artemisiifolia]|uniref:Uncharacterized protein n=1 Tax=Ambrosia artemisiifolia TaxID=4212 RepID=A0AAD5CC04_AMBAR|nr:hypothetical protein M8C21_028760 [Ambrosia artemisiifolia]